MRPAGWNGTRVHPAILLPKVYPGVFAHIEPPRWFRAEGRYRLWQGRITFEGSELALRRAGLVRPGDKLPKKPGGAIGFTSMKRNGDLRLRWQYGDEPAARDRAFVRFMEAVTSPVALGDDADSKREPPDAARDDEEDDDDWPAT